MAFINKIFSIKKKNNKNPDCTRWNGFEISDHQIRIILFRECDSQNRKLLFDSSSVKKVTNETKEKNNNTVTNGDISSNNSRSSVSISDIKPPPQISIDNGSTDFISSINSNKNSFSKLNKSEDSKSNCSESQTSYQFNRPSPDIINLGEMIFGSVALTFRGTCLKIHSIPGNEEKRKKIMCTHVFWPPPTSFKTSVTRRPPFQNSTSTMSSTSDLSATDVSLKNEPSSSLDVPRMEYEKDSGFGFNDNSTASSLSNDGYNNFLSSDPASHDNQFYYPFNGSSKSINHHIFRNLTTSLDYWPTQSYQHSFSAQGSDSERLGRHSLSHSDNGSSSAQIQNARRHSAGLEDSFSFYSNTSTRKVKLGLAILIELNNAQEKEIEIHLMEHMPILDLIMWRLRDCVQRAYWRKHLFIQIMLDGSKEAIESLQLLLCISNRNITPIWYHPLNPPEPSLKDTDATKTDLFFKLFLNGESYLKRSETENEKFVREFCELLKLLDSKDTNFFLSSLITAVLSHHLGWILSIANRNEGNTSHLCSALWTQLSEMCGAIGSPAKSAQTIVVGKAESNMEQVLSIVSYFIRYNSIGRRKEIKINPIDKEETSNKLTRLSSNYSNNKTETKVDYFEPIIARTFEMKEFTGNCKITNLKSSKNVKDCFNEFSYNLKDSADTEFLYEKPNNLSNFSVNQESVPFSDCDINVSAEITDKSKTNLKRTKTQTIFDNNAISENTQIDYHKLSKCIIQNFMPSNGKNVDEIIENFNSNPDSNKEIEEPKKESSDKVLFVLGEDELIDIKPLISPKPEAVIKKNASLSNPSENLERDLSTGHTEPPVASSSSSCIESPTKCHPRSPCHLRVKKYSGVKFNFEQYPQIATNYMKSKNLEITNIPFMEKAMKLNEFPTNFGEFSSLVFPETRSQCECGMDECYEIILQTPSNASELESTSDLIPQRKQEQYAIEKVHDKTETAPVSAFERKKVDNTIIINSNISQKFSEELASSKQKSSHSCSKHKYQKSLGINSNLPENTDTFKEPDPIKIIKSNPLKKTDKHPLESLNQATNDLDEPKIMKLHLRVLPLYPSIEVLPNTTSHPAGYEYSLLHSRNIHRRYIPGAILQAITEPISEWGCALKRDLVLAVHHSPMDQPISEAVCILADVDSWRVQLISSSTTSVNSLTGLPQIQNSSLVGIPVYSSQLVGDMLESLLELWKLRVAPNECLKHIEDKLFEIYMKSFGLSELLLSTDFCDMNYLTQTLNLHPNDVPLLLAIASTHTPQVVQKYGVGYQQI